VASASAPNLASASSVDVLTLGAKDNGGSATQSSANANATDVQNTMQEMAGDIQEDKLVCAIDERRAACSGRRAGH